MVELVAALSSNKWRKSERDSYTRLSNELLVARSVSSCSESEQTQSVPSSSPDTNMSNNNKHQAKAYCQMYLYTITNAQKSSSDRTMQCTCTHTSATIQRVYYSDSDFTFHTIQWCVFELQLWVDGTVLWVWLGLLFCEVPGSILAWAIYPWGECRWHSAKGFVELMRSHGRFSQINGKSWLRVKWLATLVITGGGDSCRRPVKVPLDRFRWPLCFWVYSERTKNSVKSAI